MSSRSEGSLPLPSPGFLPRSSLMARWTWALGSGRLRRGGRGRRRLLQLAQQLADGLARQRAHRDPVLDAIRIDTELRRVAQGIVDAELFDESTVTGAAAICSNDPVERDFFAAGTRKTNGHGHVGGSFEKRVGEANGGEGACQG